MVKLQEGWLWGPIFWERDTGNPFLCMPREWVATLSGARWWEEFLLFQLGLWNWFLGSMPTNIYIWFPPKHCMIRNGNPITIRLRHWKQHGKDYVLRDTRRTWKILYYAIKRNQGNMFITQRGLPPWALRPMSSNRELLPTLRENTQPWSMLPPMRLVQKVPKSPPPQTPLTMGPGILYPLPLTRYNMCVITLIQVLVKMATCAWTLDPFIMLGNGPSRQLVYQQIKTIVTGNSLS